MEKLRYKLFTAVLHLIFLFWLYACSDTAPTAETKVVNASLRSEAPKTENVIVLVIDGPRYSDTWGKEGQPHIPYMAQHLAQKGTFFSNFKNDGPTYTLAGHTAITTGHYQNLSNDGSELPRKPSFFQYFLKQTGLPPTKACLVTSKEKLRALSDCRDADWRGRFNPYFDCGKDGKNRSDAETLQQVIKTLQEKQPKLMLVQFLGPDANGHQNNWPGYLNALQETDRLAYELWQYIQQDEHYKDKTALLITNDHGRHADGHKDGFVSHGDHCNSCEHISLLALGPEFAQGITVNEHYDQADIPATIGHLLGFQVPANKGHLITPLF